MQSAPALRIAAAHFEPYRQRAPLESNISRIVYSASPSFPKAREAGACPMARNPASTPTLHRYTLSGKPGGTARILNDGIVQRNTVERGDPIA
jgi:hypothetical protein